MSDHLQPDDLFNVTLGGAVQALPDGRVVYLESRLDRHDNSAHTRLMALTAGGRPVPFSRGPHDSSPALSPDGRQMAFLVRQLDASQLWVMPVSGGEARQVSDLKGGVQSFAWAPDSRSLALISVVHGDRLQAASNKAETDQQRHTAGVHITSSAYYKLDGEGLFGPGQTQIVHQPLNGAARLLTD
ncbi:MAG: TolB family protein, partial [Sulfobacillus sp.]